MKGSAALDAARELQLLSGGRLEVVFHGTSMDPLLFEGDLVLVEDVTVDDIAIGDIVTYRYLDRYPTRRVVGIEPDRLTLWCDAWPHLRFRASPEDVLGRAVGRVRNDHRLDASDPEWISRRERALRSNRRARPQLAERRAVGWARDRFVPGPQRDRP